VEDSREALHPKTLRVGEKGKESEGQQVKERIITAITEIMAIKAEGVKEKTRESDPTSIWEGGQITQAEFPYETRGEERKGTGE